MDSPLDLVGGPFAVIESDPGVFTSLTRRLGIKHVELIELYAIEPWATDHLNPHGLIFCFMWRKDSHRPTDFDDPAAENVWFANQLSDDACATLAILNIVMNCPQVDVGDTLRLLRSETREMSPVMRGLAVTNYSLLREAHNSLARPADKRAAINNLVQTTLDAQKATAAKAKKEKEQRRAAKRATTGKAGAAKSAKAKGKQKARGKKKKEDEDDDDEEDEEGEDEEEEEEEAFHFIGYVPAYGKVWELDGLKSGPLEVGELPLQSTSDTSTPPTHPPPDWLSTARPALRSKMDKYGGGASEGSNIRFSCLAIVDCTYESAWDQREFWRREVRGVEGRLNALGGECEGWEAGVDQTLYTSARALVDSTGTGGGGHARAPFARDFASRRMMRDLEIMGMQGREELVGRWEEAVRNLIRADGAVDEEVAKGVIANTEHVKRTHDYEPFLKAFTEKLHEEGLLDVFLDQGRGKKKKGGVNG